MSGASPLPVLIATDVPFWKREKGNQQRIYALVHFLAQHQPVDVFYFGAIAPEAGTRLVTNCELTHVANSGFLATAFRRLPSAWQQRLIALAGRVRFHRNLASFRSPALLARFREACDQRRYAAVLIEYVWHAYLVSAVDRSHTAAILDIHDVFHRRVADYARFNRVPDKVITLEEELESYRQFDYLLAIQDRERDYLERLFPGRVLLAMHPMAPIAGAYAARLRARDRLTIVYFASFGDLNVDAIEWFSREVWNADLAQRFTLRIHGVICDTLKLDAPGIVIAGRAGSPADVYGDADIAINPVRFGSGLKIKTVEALAHGVPVVTTSVGAEGLTNGSEPFLLCADDPAAFRAALRDLTDVGLRARLSASALAFVGNALTPEACFGPLQRLIDDMERGVQ